MPDLILESTTPWHPHPDAAPLTGTDDDHLTLSANGTRTCAGGWQLTYSGVEAGAAYRMQVEVDYEGIPVPGDTLQCKVLWYQADPHQENTRGPWVYLVPQPAGANRLCFSGLFQAPEKAQQLSLRCTFRWSQEGTSRWSSPLIEPAPLPQTRPVRIAVATGQTHAHPGPSVTSIQDNIDFYAPLCERAGAEGAELILLPEIALQWRLSGSPLDLAVPAPGPESEIFAHIARRHRCRILLGLLEREGDAVYNTALLLDPDGHIEGRYRKVHLAVGGESESGILPGDGFPVFATDIGRIGCNICMDSSAAESARMVGLNGADILLLPIMGDHRADRWNLGPPVFNESRWQAIMRTRAIDNQLCLVVARNSSQGSCIVDRSGDFLAYNDGTRDFIAATLPAEDGYLTWNGACFRQINWMQRRPQLYGAYVEPDKVGSLENSV